MVPCYLVSPDQPPLPVGNYLCPHYETMLRLAQAATAPVSWDGTKETPKPTPGAYLFPTIVLA